MSEVPLGSTHWTFMEVNQGPIDWTFQRSSITRCYIHSAFFHSTSYHSPWKIWFISFQNFNWLIFFQWFYWLIWPIWPFFFHRVNWLLSLRQVIWFLFFILYRLIFSGIKRWLRSLLDHLHFVFEIVIICTHSK